MFEFLTNYIFYAFLIFTIIPISILILYLKFKFSLQITFITIFLLLFWSSIALFECVLTPIIKYYNNSEYTNIYMVGFYGFCGISISFLSIFLYLSSIKSKINIFNIFAIILFVYSLQLIGGLIGDFGYFIIRGLNEFTPEIANWIVWKFGIPISYLKQAFIGILILSSAISQFYLANLFQKKKKI